MTNAVMTERSSTGQAVGMEDVPDPQVPERARRRTYTAKYKRDILTEYDSLNRQARARAWLAVRGVGDAQPFDTVHVPVLVDDGARTVRRPEPRVVAQMNRGAAGVQECGFLSARPACPSRYRD